MLNDILIYGGSFDPFHSGHVTLLKQAMYIVNPDRAFVAPAFESPFKSGHHAEYFQRRRIVEISIADAFGNEAEKISIWDAEMIRGRRTYSYELVEEMRSIHPAAREIFFLTGSDVLERICEWKNVDRFSSACTLVVGIRKGSSMRVPEDYRGNIVFLPLPTSSDSSTEVRRRILAVEPIHDLVSSPAIDYIKENSLYRKAHV